MEGQILNSENELVQLLKTLREEWTVKINSFQMGVVRDCHFPDVPNKIFVAMGMRRTGKTYFLFQTMIDLIKHKIPLSRILYINFEDDRLQPLTQKKFAQLLDGFYSLYPENHDQECYLFLDELQNIKEWPLVVRRFFDTKNVKIFLSGSSSKLLSKEISTSLRGRSLATEIWPFSFWEFLKARSESIPDLKGGQKSFDILQKHLSLYLETGGFPGTVLLKHSDRLSILQEYISVVLLRDIIERHNISNTVLIRYMIKTLLKNAGSLFSVHKFMNDLKTQGLSASKTTVYEYLSYIEDAYLAFSVPLYSESIRKVHSNPRKIYAVDTGLIRAQTLGKNQNVGHYFENIVYLDLRRRGHTVHYYLTNTRREVDFMSCDKDGQWHLYQVCWDESDMNTRNRELEALKEAEQELGVKGIIITPRNYAQIFPPYKG